MWNSSDQYLGVWVLAATGAGRPDNLTRIPAGGGIAKMCQPVCSTATDVATKVVAGDG
jgi:hypothetical protein